MSDFCINTDFSPGDEIKIVFNIFNGAPDDTSGGNSKDKIVYIVDIVDLTPLPRPISEYSYSELTFAMHENFVEWSNVHGFQFPLEGTDYLYNTAEYYVGAHHPSTEPYDNTVATSMIINQTGHTNSAAKMCADVTRTYNGVTYDDWFLPSNYLLVKIRSNREVIDNQIAAQGGDIIGQVFEEGNIHNNNTLTHRYWASNESSVIGGTNAVRQEYIGYQNDDGTDYQVGNGSAYKHEKHKVRAVRKVQTNSDPDVGDFFEGGVVIWKREVGDSGGGFQGVATKEVDLDITVGASITNVFSQNTLQNNYSNSGVEFTISSDMGSNPQICFKFENSTTGSYQWGTNVQIFKKVEEVSQEIQAGNRVTLSYSEDAQRWISRYSFLPEYFSTYKNTFGSFRNGSLYIHDDSINKNYFYNVFYESSYTYVENIAPSQPKVFLTHSVEGDKQPTFTTFATSQNHKMATDLIGEDYIRREGTFYSNLYGDLNDPNVGENATLGDRLHKGEKLRGQTLDVKMIWRVGTGKGQTRDLEVKHSNVGFITSKGHTT